jgi:F420-dependent oxidoreductase-like protein
MTFGWRRTDQGGVGGMKVCLMIEGQEGVSWEEWVALGLACDEHGFDALFRSDHYLSFGQPTERGSLDAWATLAALTGRTDRVRLGTLVSPITFRHPSELAKSVVTADHASGGRVELGMGAGWFEPEHRAYGFPFPPADERFDMLEEQVEIVHRLWDRDEEEVTFEGRHYRLEGCHALPKPLQDPHPPLILGGGAGPRAAKLAARWADEYNVNLVTPEECRSARERLSQACEDIGRDPAELPLSLMTGTVIGADPAGLERHASRLMERRSETGDPAAFLEGLGPKRIVGTPDRVLARLAEYAEAGVERVMMQHIVHDDLETIALIGSEVIPEASGL